MSARRIYFPSERYHWLDRSWLFHLPLAGRIGKSVFPIFFFVDLDGALSRLANLIWYHSLSISGPCLMRPFYPSVAADFAHMYNANVHRRYFHRRPVQYFAKSRACPSGDIRAGRPLCGVKPSLDIKLLISCLDPCLIHLGRCLAPKFGL